MKKATAMAAAIMMSLSLAAVPTINVGAATTATKAAADVKPVTNLKGSVQADNSVKLSWDNNGAGIYFVLRKDNSTGSYRAIAMLYGTSYTDTKTRNNMTYSYEITSFANGKMTDPSNQISLDIGKGEIPLVKPTAPEHIIALPMGEDGVQIFWQSLDDESLITYFVLRSESENGNYKALTLFVPSEENSFIDKTAEAGKTYYYKVQAFNGELGDMSAAASALAGSTILDSDLIATVSLEEDVPMAQNVTAKALDSKSAEVNWESAGEGVSYGVFRSENLYDSDYVCVDITTDTKFEDNTMLNSGTDYFYKIQTIQNGELSEFTEPVKITTEASNVEAPKNLTLTQEGSKVVMNWSNFEGKDQIVGILRSETEDHGYKAIDISWSGSTYTDKTAKAGKTYFYKIQTLTNANLSVYSDIASITIK